MKMWLAECDIFLEEMMGHEGRGHNGSNNGTSCALGPGPNLAKYECHDCHGRELLLEGSYYFSPASYKGMSTTLCIELMYIKSTTVSLFCCAYPLIQSWNTIFFEKITLRELGLHIQLGHSPGVTCRNPEQCSGNKFTILDNRAIHSVCLDFCACGEASQSKTVQLLHSKFYPATVANPRSTATFRTLETFELLSYVLKVSAFEYYQALSCLTDNTGFNVPKVSCASLFFPL
jgi:hypothetical protein